jgi:adenine/guanine phosphoribosyltransferase-like PRPP-binding protein
MRTTVAIDDDVLAAARVMAERERKTLGEVISGLARQGLGRAPAAGAAVRNGVPLLPVRRPGTRVTLGLVNQLLYALP